MFLYAVNLSFLMSELNALLFSEVRLVLILPMLERECWCLFSFVKYHFYINCRIETMEKL